MKLKKTFITMGSIGGIVATIPFVVSCGENFPKNNHAKGSQHHNINKKYSYSFWLDFNPLFEDKPGEPVKITSSVVVKFESNNLYSQQDIFNSIYMMHLFDNKEQKEYFSWPNNHALKIEGKFLRSDIKEWKEDFLFKDNDESWNPDDLVVLRISHWSFTNLNPTSSTEVEQM